MRRSRRARPASARESSPRGATPARASARRPAVVDRRRNALNHAAFWLDARRAPIPARSTASSPRRSAPSRFGRQEPPERPSQIAEHALDVLLVGLARQRAQRRRRGTPAARSRRSSSSSHSVTHAAPRVSGSVKLVDVLQQVRRGCRRRARSRRSPAAAVRQHEARRRTARARPATVGRARARRRTAWCACRPRRRASTSQLLRPHQRRGQRIALDAALIASVVRRSVELGADRRPARLLDPGAAPRREVAASARRARDEIEPGRVAERELLQVLAQAVAELLGAHQTLELPHDDRRLLVDDRRRTGCRLRSGWRAPAGSDSCPPCDRPRTRPGSARAGSAARGSPSGTTGSRSSPP